MRIDLDTDDLRLLLRVPLDRMREMRCPIVLGARGLQQHMRDEDAEEQEDAVLDRDGKAFWHVSEREFVWCFDVGL